MNERNRNRLEYAICLLVLAVLPWTIIGIWVAQDSVPGLSGRPFSVSHRPLPDTENRKSLLLDEKEENSVYRELYAYYSWIHTTALEGESFLWNPDECAGIPFYALLRHQILSPFTLPLYFLNSFINAGTICFFLETIFSENIILFLSLSLKTFLAKISSLFSII